MKRYAWSAEEPSLTLLLVYAVTLLAAVLISERARRTVLSTAVLFLAVGVAYGFFRGPPDRDIVRQLANIALVTVLFTDGMKLSLGSLRAAWSLPGRALLFGFPLTLAGTAAAAHWMVHLEWPAALLVGAALAPTDPVFASAIVGREEVPGRLRHLLNAESGLNDGLALPFVVALLSWAKGQHDLHLGTVGGDLGAGVALGFVVPWVAVRLERWRLFGMSGEYRRVGILAVGLVVYAIAAVTGANPFLASFTAGATLATVATRAPAAIAPIAEVAGETLKLAALLVFGAMLSPAFLGNMPPVGWLFAGVALVVVRPVAIGLALLRTPLSSRERLVAAWFGPKGFASVVYGLLVVAAGIEQGGLVFHLIASTTALSIVMHSSTDVPVARWFKQPVAQSP